MKRIIVASIERSYSITIYPRGFHGSLEFKTLAKWNLEAKSVENAKDFAIEILSGMTLNDLEEEAYNDSAKQIVEKLSNRYKLDPDTTIGYEMAIKMFSFQVYKS